MKKYLRKIFLYLLGIVILLFILAKVNWLPNWLNPFRAREIVIDETPVLIDEMKSIAQLMTLETRDEVVVDSTEYLGGIQSSPLALINPALIVPSKRTLVLIGKGKIIAGVDLKEIHDSDIVISKDSVHLFLPKAKILDAIINPSDFETFDEKGVWTAAEVQSLKAKLKQKMMDRFMQQNNLTKANERAILVMKNFLGALGFKKSLIELRK
jgi:Protein of unknown function (DUF4230)